MGKAIVIMAGGGTDIEEGNPNAKAETILSGYTVYVSDDGITHGTMPNIGNQNGGVRPGESVDVELGYHLGDGSYTATTLADETSATAGAAQVLKDYTGWKDGSKITGTMANRGAISESLSANGTYTVPAGWHNGSGKVTQDLTTQAAKTITPGTSKQTIVESGVWVTGKQTVAGASTLTAANIKKDITIFGITGTMSGFPGGTYAIIENGVFNATASSKIVLNAWWYMHYSRGGNVSTISQNRASDFNTSTVGSGVGKSGSSYVFKMSYKYKGDSTNYWWWGTWGGTYKFKLPLISGKKITLTATITYNGTLISSWTESSSAGIGICSCGQVTTDSGTGKGTKVWEPTTCWAMAYVGSPNSGTRTITGTGSKATTTSTIEACIWARGYDRYVSSSANDQETVEIRVKDLSVTYS